MNLSWFESILYGFISGITEFMPLSSSAHQDISLLLFGAEQRDPVRDFVVHIGMLIALIFTYKSMLEQLQRAKAQRSFRSGYEFVSKQRMDVRFMRSATLPMLICLIALTYIFRSANGNLLMISGFLLLNGILLFIPGRMLQGNKDSRAMSQFDGVLIGGFAGLGALTGVSRIGCFTGLSIARGADRQQALQWAIILSVPALVLLSFLDVLQMFTVGYIPFWRSFFTYLLSGASAFAGGYCGLKLAGLIMARAGFSGFAYYSWGVALLLFILYLFAV